MQRIEQKRQDKDKHKNNTEVQNKLQKPWVMTMTLYDQTDLQEKRKYTPFSFQGFMCHNLTEIVCFLDFKLIQVQLQIDFKTFSTGITYTFQSRELLKLVGFRCKSPRADH